MAKQYLVTGSSTASGGGSVTSVFARAGAVVAVLGDYLASLVTNDSSVTGATVKDALNTLLADFGAITYPVTSVFTRTGAIIATLGDYAASLVTNDSSWAGATVKDALNSIFSGSVFSFNGRTGTVVSADADYDELQVGGPSTLSVSRTIPAGKNVLLVGALTLTAGISLTLGAGSSLTFYEGPPTIVDFIPDEQAVLNFPELVFYGDGEHVTLTSGKVSSWTDRSGKGNHATQATGAKQPTVITTAPAAGLFVPMNGLKTLKFVGGQCLQIPSLSIGTFTCFVVCQGMTDAVTIIYEHGVPPAQGHSLTSASSSDSIIHRRGAISSKNNTSWATAAATWAGAFLVTHMSTGTHNRHQAWLHGNALTASSAGGSGTSDPGTSVVNATLNIGSRNNAASLALTGEIATLLVFTPALSTGRMQAVARMLARKYDIALA